MMMAVAIILAVFSGISILVATVATAILLGQGKLTLPHTNHRRVMRERTALTLLQIRVEEESLNMRLDTAVQRRLELMADGPTPFAGDLVKKDFHPDPSTWGDA